METWDEGANQAVAKIVKATMDSQTLEPDMAILDAISDYISAWIAEGKTQETETVYALLEKAGTQGVLQILKAGSFRRTEMVNTLVRKQHDYGHDNINKFGVVGVAIRLCDKIARAKNLLGRNSEAENESLMDTWVDIVGYSAISIMLNDGSFQLQLQKDTENVNG